MGQKIDVSLLEAQVATLANIASNYLIGGIEAKRMGTAHVSIVPYQGFESKDGWVLVGALNDLQFGRLCEAIGQPELAQDPRYSTNPQRVANRQELIPLLSEHLKKKTTAEWVTILEKFKVPCGPINNMQQVFSDPQVLHRGMLQVSSFDVCHQLTEFQEIEHPTAGNIKLTGIPVKFSSTKAEIRYPPPLLGQHTRQVLLELGYTQEEIQKLAQQQCIALSEHSE